ncbi:MAG: J domain-containing protein [Cyanobacteriota bacterium]|nr:J domain-containing protein [Cyanobacteriota bacterium]
MSATPPPFSTTHYQRLGLLPSASSAMIRQAYRRLSKHYHPDTSALPPETAIRRFQDLHEAYAVLSNPTQRAMYDATLWLRDPLTPPIPSASTPHPLDSPQTRPLSGGEICALLLMAGTLAGCLALAIVMAWLREGSPLSS